MGEALSCLYLNMNTLQPMTGVRDCTCWAWGQKGEAGPCPGRAFTWPKSRCRLSLDDSALCCPMAPPLVPLFSSSQHGLSSLLTQAGLWPSARACPSLSSFTPPALTHPPTAQRLFPRSPTGVCRPAHSCLRILPAHCPAGRLAREQRCSNPPFPASCLWSAIKGGFHSNPQH